MGKISIGGKEFFGSAEFILDADTVTSDQPGDDSSFITDMGVGPLTIRVRGDCTEETDSLSDVRKEIMTVGEISLILDTGWKYKVFRRSFRPVRVAGTKQTGLNGYHNTFEAVFVCEEPYQFSTPTACRAKAITSNNQEWSAEDMPCDNLLDNWSLEVWSGGVSGVNPDGWTTTRAAANYPARESTHIKTGTYSAAMKWNGVGSNSIFRQTLVGFDVSNSVGKPATFGVWVKANAATKTFIQIYDGTTSYNSSYNSGSDWEFLEVSCTIDSSATSILLTVDVRDDTNEVYIDGAVYVIDSSIIDSTFSRSISTDGEVDAVPDIQITGGIGTTYNRSSTYDNDNTDSNTYSEVGAAYILKKTYTFTADSTYAWTLDTVGLDVRNSTGGQWGYGKVTYTAASLNGGAETDVPSAEWPQLGTVWSTGNSVDPAIQCAGNEDLVVKFYCKRGVAGTGQIKELRCDISALKLNVCTDAQIYNTADTTVKCDVANSIEEDMVFRINADGTGTIDYNDDFTSDKYLDAMYDYTGTTYDDPNDELDFGNSENIIYKIDNKYPVTGIPTFTATIDIDTGTPTIKISSDGSTYYDIDTAIVDNVSTVYELDNTSNLSLKGLTTFYIRLDCGAAATCSLVEFKLDIDIVTIDAENPVITEGGSASTVQCDQHANSGLNCTVVFIYSDRRWPG